MTGMGARESSTRRVVVARASSFAMHLCDESITTRWLCSTSETTAVNGGEDGEWDGDGEGDYNEEVIEEVEMDSRLSVEVNVSLVRC